MLRILRRRWAMIFLVHCIAAAVGVGAAVGAAKVARPHAAFAANHCTRYAPVNSQDSNCTVQGSMIFNSYSTCCTGLRDSNVISISSNRWLHLWYSNSSTSTSYGVFLSTGASSGYAKALCSYDGASVNGRCTTYWHD